MLAKVHSGAVYGIDAYPPSSRCAPGFASVSRRSGLAKGEALPPSSRHGRLWRTSRRGESRSGVRRASPVEIEVNEGRGDVPSPRLWNTGPQAIIVGLPDAAVVDGIKVSRSGTFARRLITRGMRSGGSFLFRNYVGAIPKNI